MLADAEELMPLHLPRHAYILATAMLRHPLTTSPLPSNYIRVKLR